MIVQVNTQSAQTLLVPKRVRTDVSAFYGFAGAEILAYDSDVIGGELYNVMSTLIGDDVMNPTYGCNLPRRVFEPVTAALEQLCIQDVVFAAQEWVPQVTVDMRQTIVYADAGRRLVGVAVAYAYGGAGWLQPVALAQGFSGLLG